MSMFGSEIRQMLIQVISSWQVLAVTVVLVIYISIVNYVARLQYRSSSRPSIRRPKRKKSETTANPEVEELGLEEGLPEK